MAEPFREPVPVVDISAWPLAYSEPVGNEQKDWHRDPDGHLWLFKPRTEHEGWAQGEDWAEKIVAHIADGLGLPAARVELATRHGSRGSISRSLRPDGWELQHGAVLLTRVVPDFAPRSRSRRGHALANIADVLQAATAPAGSSVGMSAFDCFAGYLVLDALVANQDRHEENWAVLRPLPGHGQLTLAPTYDHGSSLGFNLRDDRRSAILERVDGLKHWADRGRAQRFDREAEGRLTLVGLAAKALSMASAPGRATIVQACTDARPELWTGIVAQVVHLSHLERTFILELLAVNLRRLNDAL